MPETLGNKTGEWRWTAMGMFRPVFAAIGKALRQIHVRRKPHTLHLQETLALGDKRFLAVVEWKNERLLIGVTAHTITLLEAQGEKEARRFAWEKERIA
jgi:hypothetical protein